MDFNTILFRFGLEPEQFDDLPIEPIKYEKGYIFEVNQVLKERVCPFCSSTDIVIKDHDVVEINASVNLNEIDILRIKKVRFKCKKCGRSFTPKLVGTYPYAKLTNQSKRYLIQEFVERKSFSDIAKIYHISKQRVLQIFDEEVKYIVREKLPEILCIDEIKYNSTNDSKYACVLTDFDKHKFVDIIKSRKSAFLNEYFSSILPGERANVKYFITDMYEGYYQIKRKFFKDAIHIVDIFHVIKQLKETVNHLRKTTMDKCKDDNVYEANFMKKNWRYFLIRNYQIPYGYYSSKVTGEIETNDNALIRCLKLNSKFMNGYDILQELLSYKSYKDYESAKYFLERIIYRLNISESEELQKVGRTYENWKYEIINAFDIYSKPRYYTNGIAESMNNQIKTLTKISYGYKNFDRFRKRILLITNYKKESE